MRIKKVWELGNRSANVFVSPIEQGPIYIYITWSSMLTLVLETVFIKSIHKAITQQEIAKAKRLAERINAAGAITISNWRHWAPPAAEASIGCPFATEYPPEGVTESKMRNDSQRVNWQPTDDADLVAWFYRRASMRAALSRKGSNPQHYSQGKKYQGERKRGKHPGSKNPELPYAP